jgi:serine/threonine-protein kinase RsbW
MRLVGNRGTSPDGAGLGAKLPDPLSVGGRGLPLIAALADAATFTPGQAGQVLLRITKRLTPQSPSSPARPG